MSCGNRDGSRPVRSTYHPAARRRRAVARPIAPVPPRTSARRIARNVPLASGAPMEVNVKGRRLWFDVDGPALVPDGATMQERPTVVLLHGGPGSFDHSYLKPDFARRAGAAQVVYLDLPGHGRSEWGEPADWSFELCADAMRDFCDVLAIERPVVLGHSLGGMVALVYAARHTDHPRALVLSSTM